MKRERRRRQRAGQRRPLLLPTLSRLLLLLLLAALVLVVVAGSPPGSAVAPAAPHPSAAPEQQRPPVHHLHAHPDPHCREPHDASDGHRDYILGYAAGYGADVARVCPFLRSIATWSPCAVVVLFTDQRKAMAPLLAQVGARAHLLQLEDATPGNATALPRGTKPGMLRWLDFQRYVAANVHRMRGLMVTDVRDVLLQSSVWHHTATVAALHHNATLFSLEGSHNTVHGIGGVNHLWVEACYGKAAADALLGMPTSCNGVTLGAAGAVHAYLNTMVELITQQAAAKNLRCLVTESGAEQGIHNYLLHALGPRGSNNLSFTVSVLANGQSPVYTLLRGFPVTIDAFHQVTIRRNSSAGEIVLHPSLLHQYDRSHTLFLTLQKAYSCIEGGGLRDIQYNTRRRMRRHRRALLSRRSNQ